MKVCELTKSNNLLFLLAPILTIAPAFAAWAVIPFNAELVLSDINAGLLYVLAMTSIAVYGVIITIKNSKTISEIKILNEWFGEPR